MLLLYAVPVQREQFSSKKTAESRLKSLHKSKHSRRVAVDWIALNCALVVVKYFLIL